MAFKNMAILLFFSLIFSCQTVLPMEKATEEKDEKVLENFVHSKISMLNHVSKMIEGISPEKKAIKLPEPWKTTSPKTFCKDLGKGFKTVLDFRLAKKGISEEDIQKEMADIDKYYERTLRAKKNKKKFKPVSKELSERIIKQAKSRGIDDFVVERGSGFSQANYKHMEVNEKRFGKYPLDAQVTIVEHELTHALNHDIARSVAIEQLLKRKSSNGELSPESKQLHLVCERHFEANADLVGASQNEQAINGYEQFTEEFIKEDGIDPFEDDEHPAHIDRREAARILKNINNTWKEYQKSKTAKRRLFEDSENQPAVTNAPSVPLEINNSKKTKLIEKSI